MERSLLGILATFREEGFTYDFRTRPGGVVECGQCHAPHPAEHAWSCTSSSGSRATPTRRRCSRCARWRCPTCGIRGTLVLTFGPESTREDDDVLELLDDARRRVADRAGARSSASTATGRPAPALRAGRRLAASCSTPTSTTARCFVARDGDEVDRSPPARRHRRLGCGRDQEHGGGRARQGTGVGRALVEHALEHARAATAPAACSSPPAPPTSGTCASTSASGSGCCPIERDAFTPEFGYPEGLEVDGIPLLDRVWFDQALDVDPRPTPTPRSARRPRTRATGRAAPPSVSTAATRCAHPGRRASASACSTSARATPSAAPTRGGAHRVDAAVAFVDARPQPRDRRPVAAPSTQASSSPDSVGLPERRRPRTGSSPATAADASDVARDRVRRAPAARARGRPASPTSSRRAPTPVVGDLVGRGRDRSMRSAPSTPTCRRRRSGRSTPRPLALGLGVDRADIRAMALFSGAHAGNTAATDPVSR